METKISDLEWKEETMCDGEDTLFTAHLEDGGRITVLDRMTGFDFGRDIESGYKDKDGKFWLASGNCDVRRYGFNVDQAIDWIKSNANNCVGV